jgi:hypothetical protein
LSFRLVSSAGVDANDRFAVEVSSDGGASWLTLQTYSARFTPQRTEVFNISNFISANTTVRFRIVDGLEAGDTWSVDNVNIQYSPDGTFDMTGAYIRTCNDVQIAAAFGQNPTLSGNSDNEAMDLGMGIPPYGSMIKLKKTASTEFAASGDLVTYTYQVKPALTFSTSVNNVTVEDDTCSPVVYSSGDSNSNNALDPGETWNFTCTIRLYANTTNTAIAYAYYGPDRIHSSPSQATVKLNSSLGDTVWLDENGDGIQDVGEPGIPNAKITLTGTNVNGNPVSLTTYTDSNGHYLFPNVPPSNASGYAISVDPTSLPAGLAANPTYDENGTGTPNTTTVVLIGGIEYTTADFGYNWSSINETDNNTGSGMIGDRVWIDANGNGKQDPGEPGQYNVTLQLITAGADGFFGTADDVVAASTTTDYAGNYAFDSLNAGAYIIRIPSAPAGDTPTSQV